MTDMKEIIKELLEEICNNLKRKNWESIENKDYDYVIEEMEKNVETWLENKAEEYFEDCVGDNNEVYQYIDDYQEFVQKLSGLDIPNLLENENSEVYYSEFKRDEETIKQLLHKVKLLIAMENEFDCEQMIEEIAEKAERRAINDGSDLDNYNEDGEEEYSWL